MHDTVLYMYKNASIKLIFTNYFDFEIQKKQIIKLIGIYTEDKKIKTKSGIKVGDERINAITKLDSCGYSLHVLPDPRKGKDYSLILLYDEKGEISRDVYFYFKNNILYAIAVEYGGPID